MEGARERGGEGGMERRRGVGRGAVLKTVSLNESKNNFLCVNWFNFKAINKKPCVPVLKLSTVPKY